MCRHRPPLAGSRWVDVPSVLWYFRGHGRTIPDLEFLLIAVLVLRHPLPGPPPTNPTPSNPSHVAAPPCPRHADRGHRGPARASAWATTGPAAGQSWWGTLWWVCARWVWVVRVWDCVGVGVGVCPVLSPSNPPSLATLPGRPGPWPIQARRRAPRDPGTQARPGWAPGRAACRATIGHCDLLRC